MTDIIAHPINLKSNKEKFQIQQNQFGENRLITEIRGERSSGKTELMIDCFLHDFSDDLQKNNFTTFIVSPNSRISEYFRTTIRNKLYPLYAEKQSELKRLENIIRSRIVTLSEIDRGDRLIGLDVKNVYVDPADFMTIIDIISLLQNLKFTNNIYFFRNH